MEITTPLDNMITQQIRSSGVDDSEILSLFHLFPRDHFIQAPYQLFAFSDMHIPIDQSGEMLSPKEEGQILKSLSVLPTETVLVVGAGGVYLAVLLAKLASHVYLKVETSMLKQYFDKKMQQLDIDNVTILEGCSVRTCSEYAPYDIAVLTQAVSKLSSEWKSEVNVGGRLFCIQGKKPVMQAMILTRTEKEHWESRVLYETMKPYFVDTEQLSTFAF